MHSIHGRAPAIATGLAASRTDLSVWVITGDGDALSIGGNHLIHALRRNVNIKILLFNNRIYGLTKGQYSPTSEQGKVTKSTPFGSLDHPFNPVSLALGADASFVARTIDSDRRHLTSVLRAAADHQGAAFIEIYQNCPIFNDDAFAPLKEHTAADQRLIKLEHGEPVRFQGGTQGLRFGRHGQLEATVVDETSAMNLQVKVTDLSLGGCYVEMLAPLPLGSSVELALDTAQGAIHARGKVVVAQAGMGMSIAFTSIAPEDFEMLREIAPPVPRSSERERAIPRGPKRPAPSNGRSSRRASQIAPSTQEVLEAILRILLRKGIVSEEEMAGEFEKLITAKS